MPNPQRRAPSAAAPWCWRRRQAQSLCLSSVVSSTNCQLLYSVILGSLNAIVFGCGIEHDKDRRLSLFHRAEHIGKKAAFRKLPVHFLHLFGRGREPEHAVGAVGAPPVEPAMAADLRKRRRSSVRRAMKSVRSSPSLAEICPVDPADLIVLAIGVVVADLRVADLVAGEQQRHALRQQQAGELVLAQLPAQRHDLRIVGRAFIAAIVAVIVVWSRRDCLRRWPRCASRCS